MMGGETYSATLSDGAKPRFLAILKYGSVNAATRLLGPQLSKNRVMA